MSTLKNTLRLVASARQFSRSAIRSNNDNVHEGYKRIKLVQARFQKPDGLPVHLKGGVTDRILFGITAGLCVFALGWIGTLIFTLSNPQKHDD